MNDDKVIVEGVRCDWRVLVAGLVGIILIVAIVCNIATPDEIKAQDKARWAKQEADHLKAIARSMHRVEKDGHLWMVRLSGHAGGLAHHPECENKKCNDN